MRRPDQISRMPMDLVVLDGLPPTGLVGRVGTGEEGGWVGQIHLAPCCRLASEASVCVTAGECFSRPRGSYHCNEAVKEASSPG